MQKFKQYYHVSPALFKKGDRISATSSSVVGKNYNFSGHMIYMTTSPYPHFTIFDDAVAGKWNVYEVKPINPKKVWKGMWDDLVTPEIEIIKKIGRVGDAGRGLARYSSGLERTRNGQRTKLFKKESKKKDIGDGVVDPTDPTISPEAAKIEQD